MKRKVKSKNIRRRNILPVVVLATSAVIGAAMIGLGVYNNATSDYNALAIKSEESLSEDVSNKTEEVNNLKSEREEEYNISALSDKYYELSRKISLAEDELLDLEAELYNVQSGAYDGLKARSVTNSLPFIISGVVLVVFGAGLYAYLNNREKRNKILSVDEA